MTVTEMPEYTQTKTATETNVKIQGNLNADKVKMTVSQDGAAHIMSLLTDLYSDPNLAVLREYSSNAIDSHKEVLGKMPQGAIIRPVEITLPSSLSSNFIVQDWGTGMSTDDIRDIYSSYGKSTKQRDFNQIGAFGLGCKSALTLTQQFTINSVKNGQKTVAIISRGEDGVGEVNIVSSTDTTEPNGVKVTIPIPRVSDFLGKVHNFFYTWEPGTVLVDGKQPSSMVSDGFVESQSGMFMYAFNDTIKNYDVSRGFNVILGGISYPVSFNDVWGWGYNNDSDAARATASTGSFYVEIPIGSVDLTPSREGLRYSQRTTKFLKEIMKTVSAEVFKMSTEEIENAPTRKDALINAARFSAYRRNFKNVPTAKWNGEVIPPAIDVSGLQISLAPDYARAKTNRYQVSTFRIFDHTSDKQRFIVIKVKDNTESGRVARNAHDYINSLHDPKSSVNIRDISILATQDTIDSPWVLETDIVEFVDLDDFIEAAKEYRKENRDLSVPRAKSSPIRYKTIGRTTDKGVSTFTLEELKPSEISAKAMYVKSSDSSSGISVFRNLASSGTVTDHYTDVLSNIWDTVGLTDEDQIVVLENNKTVEALNKRVKSDLTHFPTVVRDSYKEFKKTLEYTDKYFYGIMNNPSSDLGKIFRDILTLDKSMSSIPDQEIIDIIERYRRVSKISKTITTYGLFVAMYDLSSADTNDDASLQRKIDQSLLDIPKRYPLLNIGQYYQSEHLDKSANHAMLYMKAVQESLNERKS